MRTQLLICWTFCLLVFAGNLVQGQNVSVSEDESYTPDPSAMLDVYSQDKGILIPRLTTAQRLAITSPANGLMVFDTDFNSFFYYFDNGSKAGWNNLASVNSAGSTVSDALFAVVNNNGDTVFAVYPEGVQINVGDGLAKSAGSKGGFAVAGISSGKGTGTEYMRVTPDSVRIYVENGTSKASKGGFAVAGISSGKGIGNEYLRVTTDSIRMYVEQDGTKASKGGFAVAGISSGKGITNEYLRITTDSVRIYVDDGIGKASKGGFAVAGISSGKGISNEYFRVTNDSVRIYVEDGVGKASKGGFAVAGISSGKGSNQEILRVTKDSTRINVSNPDAGFSIGNTETGDAQSLMKLTKENYFIGHESGINNKLGLGDNGRYNSFIGYQAGKSATTGYRNVLLGYQSGLSLDQGYDNIFVGYKSGLNVTNAFNNVFIGTNVGTNSTGSSNIFIGDSVGFQNLDGYDNVFMGFASGKTNTAGHHNVFIGSNSAKSNLDGYDNVMIGANAGFTNENGSSNVLIGDRVGYSNTSGSYNVILGNLAGYNNSTGSDNIILGYEAGRANIEGNGNVYIGKESGHSDTDGNDNVYIGRKAGYTNTIGLRNIFIGSEAGRDCNASENTYIGYQAGIQANGHYNTLLGTNAGYSRVAGNTSVLIGTEAGYYQQGSDNTIIGTYAGRGASSKTGVKNVFIGFGAGYYETGSNKLYIESCDNNVSDVYNPLIYGDFQLNQVIINNALAINTNKTAPTEALDVSGNGKFSGTLTGTSFNGNVNTGIGGYVGYSSSGPRIGFMSYSATVYGSDLGIASSYNLNMIGGNINMGDGYYIGGSVATNPRITFDKTNSQIEFSNCNVGIGTTDPAYKLHVYDVAETTTSGTTAAYFSSTAGTTSGTAYGLRCYSYAYGSSNSYAVYADADGGSTTGGEYAFYGLGDSYFSNNVGIGTSASSSSKLHVYTNGSSTYPQIELTETTSGDGARINFDNSAETTHLWTLYGRADDTNTDSYFNIYYSGLGNIMVINGSGNVGIDRTPTTNQLEVNGNASKTTAGSWLANSDRRIKTDISDIDSACATILKLHPVKFKYTNEWKKKNPSIEDKYYYNFIAQEYQKVFPESVKESGEYLDGDPKEILQMDSYNAEIVAIKAVQELIAKTQSQQQKINDLQNQVNELIQTVEELKKK